MGARNQDGRLRGRRRAVVWTLVSVIVLALVASSVLFVALRMNKSDDLPAGVPPRPAPIAATPEINAVSATAPQPTASGVTRQIAAAARAPQLGEFTGQVSDSLTGAILWSKSPSTPRVPASNTKILTAAAALLGLPHDARLTTTVVVGTDGQVIVKGAGDPTLSAQSKRSQTFYTDPGRISDLADQVRRSGVPVTSVAVDTSAYTGPTMDSSWSRDDIKGGDIAPIEALMTDGARIDPLNEYSPRVDDPARTAGEQLAKALDVDAPVTNVTAPAGARTVATVRSAPLVTRVNDMLRYSDNVLAEALGLSLIHISEPTRPY